MHASTLLSRGISGVCVLALALLLASCKATKQQNFTVGGTVSGLTGTGLVLQINGGSDLAISANGSFTFPAKLKKDASYNATVLTQPSGQNCRVDNGTGTVSANVSNVAVTCATNASTVGGMVSGLTSTGLVLQNSGGNDLAISADGAFTFSTALASGASYSVTVLTQPSGQGCSVANGSGNIAGANVTNVAVACAAPPAAPTLSLGFGVKELRFTWLAVGGADFYRLLENPDGVSGYTEVATNLTALSHNHTIPVHRRLNARYILEACNAAGCTASNEQILGTNLTQAIGYVKASNPGVTDEFGNSVALSGDGNTLAVGAPNEDSGTTGINTTPNEAAPNAGAVYVFARIAGAWQQQAYVKASNTGAGDNFGISVALSGDGNALAVGARSEGSNRIGVIAGIVDEATAGNAAPDSGAVYVYTRSAGAWSQQAYVKASNTEAGDLFGNSVALSGDGNTLAVGAVFESSARMGVTAGIVDEAMAGNAASAAGAVYVYTRNGGAWAQQAYVKASNTETMDLFGNSVALSGDGNTLAVGAVWEASGSIVINSMPNEVAFGAGAVYVYARPAGAWSQQAYVKASNTGASDEFGTSVALSDDGNTLAVGAPFEAGSGTGIGGMSNELAANAGAAYVYNRIGATWSHQAYVKASNTKAGDNFGWSVALSGDGNALAVGAYLENSAATGIDGNQTNDCGVASPFNCAADSGAVYVYARSAGTWSQQAYAKTPNPEFNDQFGNSVALSGDGSTLAVGARREDGNTPGVGGIPNNSATDAGAVYLY